MKRKNAVEINMNKTTVPQRDSAVYYRQQARNMVAAHNKKLTEETAKLAEAAQKRLEAEAKASAPLIKVRAASPNQPSITYIAYSDDGFPIARIVGADSAVHAITEYRKTPLSSRVRAARVARD
jgi:hypothetical protein